MGEFADVHWWSGDGLRLHARDYPGDPARPPILCMHGLTRNARDYALLAGRLSAAGWRVIVPEFRGRGESAHAKDPATYTPPTYAQDIEALLAELGITRFAAIGTSLGGIVAMLLAAARPERTAGTLLNDVGPVIEAGGLARIRGYVGRANVWPTWLHAARHLAEQHRAAYPGNAIDDWLAMAKRLYRLNSAGRVTLDYDVRIADPFRTPGGEAGADLWPAFAAFTYAPLLIVRGALSDILSETTVAAMRAAAPDAATVTVAATGHAPTLDEPEATAAIDAWLDRVRGAA